RARDRRHGLAVAGIGTGVRVGAARAGLPAVGERADLGAHEALDRLADAAPAGREPRPRRRVTHAAPHHVADLRHGIVGDAGKAARTVVRAGDRAGAAAVGEVGARAEAPADRGERVVVGRAAGVVRAATGLGDGGGRLGGGAAAGGAGERLGGAVGAGEE